LQSHAGEIHFLPALPRAWRDGSVKGLRARGNVEVNLSWANGKATRALLRANTGDQHKLRPPRGQKFVSITAGGEQMKFTPSSDGAVLVKFSPRQSCGLSFS